MTRPRLGADCDAPTRLTFLCTLQNVARQRLDFLKGVVDDLRRRSVSASFNLFNEEGRHAGYLRQVQGLDGRPAAFLI